MKNLISHITGIIKTYKYLNDVEFFEIAHKIFKFQMKECEVYQSYVREKGIEPVKISKLTEIPPIPESAFKDAFVISFPEDLSEAVFITSGTTTGKSGRHFIRDLSLYETSLRTAFKHFCLPDIQKIKIYSLIPPWNERFNSSLSYMISSVIEGFGTEESLFLPFSIDMEEIIKIILKEEKSDDPVFIVGVALDLYALIKEMEKKDIFIKLPKKSRIFETGGFKGKKIEILRKGLYEAIIKRLGVDKNFIIGEFGMTELLSQAYDIHDWHCFKNPPWMKTFVFDPVTLTVLPEGKKGLLCHYDLCNVWTCMAILTSDIGEIVGDGFIIHGRASGSEPRGCSLDARI